MDIKVICEDVRRFRPAKNFIEKWLVSDREARVLTNFNSIITTPIPYKNLDNI